MVAEKKIILKTVVFRISLLWIDRDQLRKKRERNDFFFSFEIKQILLGGRA